MYGRNSIRSNKIFNELGYRHTQRFRNNIPALLIFDHSDWLKKVQKNMKRAGKWNGVYVFEIVQLLIESSSNTWLSKDCPLINAIVPN